MNDNPETIQRQIDETKTSLAGKLEALESQVTEATETVEAVKETVNSVKERIRRASHFLSLKERVERQPWTAFACAVAAGSLAGYLLGGSRKEPSRRRSPTGSDPLEQPWRSDVAAVPRSARNGQPAAKVKEGPSWLREQMGALADLAVGSLLGSVRDLAAQNLPEGLGKSVSQEVDRFTARLGIKPIAGPVIPPKQPAV